MVDVKSAVTVCPSAFSDFLYRTLQCARCAHSDWSQWGQVHTYSRGVVQPAARIHVRKIPPAAEAVLLRPPDIVVGGLRFYRD